MLKEYFAFCLSGLSNLVCQVLQRPVVAMRAALEPRFAVGVWQEVHFASAEVDSSSDVYRSTYLH